LNIFCPVNARPLSLPVLVFIHGGGFQIGSNWWPQYDLRRLVLLSIEIGQPIVGVGIK
jgi:carboxylesterase type B